jgi:hypothetical protein
LILRNHPDHDPAHAFQLGQAPHVLDVLAAVSAVLVSVVLGGHFELFPAHVEHGDEFPAFVNRYLRGRYGQARVDQKQP